MYVPLPPRCCRHHTRAHAAAAACTRARVCMWFCGAGRSHGCAAAGTTTPHGPTTTTVTAPTHAQVLHKLPHVNQQAKPVSADLGSYDIVSCSTGGGSSLSCEMDGSYDMDAISNAPANSVIQYGQSVVIYSGVAIVLAVLCILFSCLFVIGRYCCACCGRTNCCAKTIQCGGYEPTARQCGCGVVTDTTGMKAAAYPRRERIATAVALWSFLATITAFIIIGAVRGFLGFPEAAKEVAPALTSAFMPTINGLLASTQGLVADMGSTVLAPTLLNLNTTLQSGLNLHAVHGGLDCIVTSIDNLPDIGPAVNFLTAMNASLHAADPVVVTLTGHVNHLVTLKDNITANVAALSATVTSLAGSMAAVTAAAGTVNASVTTLAGVKAATVPSPHGIIPTASAALTLMLPDHGVPNATYLAAASGPADVTDTSGTGTMNRLISPAGSPAMDGNANEVGLLAARLRVINDTLAALRSTDYAAVGVSLATLANMATTTRTTTIPAMLAALDSAAAAVAALPTSAAVLPNVYGVRDAADAVTLAPVLGDLAVMNGIIIGMPSFNTLLNLIDSIVGVGDIIPCAMRIIDEVHNFNATLVQLPPALSSALDVINKANATVQSALSQVQSVRAQIVDAQTQIDSINVSTYVAQVNSAWAAINGSRASFNLSSIVDRVSSLDGAIPVNFTALRLSVVGLNATLASVVLDPSLPSTLASFESNKTALLADAGTWAADTTTASRGYCTVDPTLTCDVNGDCPSATCASVGVFRCAHAPATACTTDSACTGAGDRCLADATRAVIYKARLDALAVPSPASAGLAALASINAALAPLDVDTPAAQVAGCVAAVAAVDTSAISAQITTLGNSLAAFDTATITSSLNALNGVIGSLDMGSFVSQVGDLNDTMTGIKTDQRSMVAGAAALVGTLQDILNVQLHTYVGWLSASSLGNAITANGTGGLLSTVASVANDMYTRLADTPQTLFELPSLDIMGMVPADDINKYTGGAASSGARSAGLIYFAMSIAWPDKLLPLHDSRAYAVLTDSAGVKYGNDLMCVTDACIATTVEYYSTMSTSEVSDSLVPISVAPLVLVNLLWIAPGVIVLWGILGGLSTCLCRTPRWQKCPLGCMTGCMMLQTPICFLLAALIFPMALVMGDACASGPNVGYAVLLSMGDGLCDLVSGTGTSDACSLSQGYTLPSGDRASINAVVDFPAYYRGVVGGDSTCTGAVSPWSDVVAAAAAQVRVLPYLQAAYYLGGGGAGSNPLADAGVTLKPAMTDVFYTATNSTANLLANFLVSVTSDVATCGALHGMLEGTTGIMCCTMLKPLYWLASAFYIIALVFCFCGLPIGILARKRVPSAPWGAVAQEPSYCCCCACGRGAAPSNGNVTVRNKGTTRVDSLVDEALDAPSTLEAAAAANHAASPAPAPAPPSRGASGAIELVALPAGIVTSSPPKAESGGGGGGGGGGSGDLKSVTNNPPVVNPMVVAIPPPAHAYNPSAFPMNNAANGGAPPMYPVMSPGGGFMMPPPPGAAGSPYLMPPPPGAGGPFMMPPSGGFMVPYPPPPGSAPGARPLPSAPPPPHS